MYDYLSQEYVQEQENHLHEPEVRYTNFGFVKIEILEQKLKKS